MAPAIASTSRAGQLEADVEGLRPDVEQQVARGGRGAVARAVQRDERMQFGGPRSGEQPVARVGADRGDHRQMLGRVAETDGAHQTRDVGAARRAPFPRRRRRWWRPGRWRPESAAPAPAAALDRAHRDPSATVAEIAGQDGKMAASPQSLCEFIDASPSPFHVCVTVARAVGGGGLHRTRRERGAGRRTPAATSPSGPDRWWRGGRATTPARRSASSAATPTARTCGSSSIRTGSSPAGRWWRSSPTAARG